MGVNGVGLALTFGVIGIGFRVYAAGPELSFRAWTSGLDAMSLRHSELQASCGTSSGTTGFICKLRMPT